MAGKPGKFLIFLIVPTLLLQACVSAPVNVSPPPPAQYEVLGPVTGLECGLLLAGVIPVRFNSRLERAYHEALGTIPGTASLINVKVREDWFWVPLGVTRCAIVTGDAVKEVGP